MKRSALLVLATLILASVTFAQQNPADAPATKADIEKYLDLMHTRDMMKNVMDTMSNQVRLRLKERLDKQPGMTPEEEDRAIKLEVEIFKDLPVEDLINVMIPIYEKHFTKGDIDGLVIFYSSPTGQKVLKELPSITREGMQAAMPVAQKLAADAEKRVNDQIAQMQKEENANSKKQPQQN